jgi:hypothetical protein
MISAVCSSNGSLSCERDKQDTSLSGRNMGSNPLHTTNVCCWSYELLCNL